MDNYVAIAGKTTGKFDAVRAADADHVTRHHVSFDTNDSFREQALAAVAKRVFCTVVNGNGAGGLLEKRNPTFAAFEPR